MGAISFWFLKFTGVTFSNDELAREYNKSATFSMNTRIQQLANCEDEVLVSVR